MTKDQRAQLAAHYLCSAEGLVAEDRIDSATVKALIAIGHALLAIAEPNPKRKERP